MAPLREFPGKVRKAVCCASCAGKCKYKIRTLLLHGQPLQHRRQMANWFFQSVNHFLAPELLDHENLDLIPDDESIHLKQKDLAKAPLSERKHDL